MVSEPFISVCVPAFNGREFIASAVESIINQSFKSLELIISDDASADETPNIIGRFKDFRIRLIRNDANLGMGANWNQVLSNARGKYVKLLGQDDVLEPDCLARQAEVLEAPENRNVVLAICNRNIIDASGRVVLRRKLAFRQGVVCGPKLIRRCTRAGMNLIGEPVVGLFRREALLKTKMCDPANPYLLDLALWAELLKHGDAFIDPAYLASFRVSKNAASARIGLRQAAYFRQFVKGLRKDLCYRPSVLDSCLASVLSFHWCLLRNLFLKVSLC